MQYKDIVERNIQLYKCIVFEPHIQQQMGHFHVTDVTFQKNIFEQFL